MTDRSFEAFMDQRKSGKMSQDVRKVFEVIDSQGRRGMTNQEGQAETGLMTQTYSPRRKDLVNAGLCLITSRRRGTGHGCSADVIVSHNHALPEDYFNNTRYHRKHVRSRHDFLLAKSVRKLIRDYNMVEFVRGKGSPEQAAFLRELNALTHKSACDSMIPGKEGM